MNRKSPLIFASILMLGYSMGMAVENTLPKKRPLPLPPKSRTVKQLETVETLSSSEANSSFLQGNDSTVVSSLPDSDNSNFSSSQNLPSSSLLQKKAKITEDSTEETVNNIDLGLEPSPTTPDNNPDSPQIWETKTPKNNSNLKNERFLSKNRQAAEDESESPIDSKQLQQYATEDLKTSIEAAQCYYSTIEPKFTNSKVREALISLGEYLPPIREKIKTLYADYRGFRDPAEIKSILNEIYQSIQGVISTSKRSTRALMMSIPEYINEAKKADKKYPTARNNADLQMIVSLSSNAKENLKQCLTKIPPFKGEADTKIMDTLKSETNQTLEIANNLKEYTGEVIAKKFIESQVGK